MRNNQLMSVTADTSQDPIGPCEPLEQSVDSCRHSAMEAWSSALDFGAHPGGGYYYRGAGVWTRVRVYNSDYVRVRVRVRLRLRVRVRVTVRVSRGRARVGRLGSGSG